MRATGLLCFAAITGLAACAAPRPAMTQPEARQRGEVFAAGTCSGCHAIGRTGDSPHPDAVPFRTLSQKYPVRALEEALAEGITVGHPDMPPFALSPPEIDDLLDYLESIQDPV